MSNQRAMKRKMMKGQIGNSERPMIKEKELSPEEKKQIQVTNAALTDLLYDDRTRPEIENMLSRGDPMMTIPTAVNTVFMKFEDMTQDKGVMPLDIKLACGVHLFSEIMEMGEAKVAVPEDLTEQQMMPILRETIQKYIERGLKEGTIDPIELQQRVEPLLTDQERAIGAKLGKQHGVPMELQQSQSNMMMTQKAQAPLKAENAQLKKGNQNMESALQGIASQEAV